MIKACCPIEPDFDLVKAHLRDSFDSGQVSNFGPCCEKLTKELKVFLNIPHEKEIVLTSSGHSALMAGYFIAGMCSDKKVLGPSYTFPSTMTAATLQGMKYKAYDTIDDAIIDYSTFYSDIYSIVAPLSVIPDLENIRTTCNLYSNVRILFDAASAFGTPDIYSNVDITCLSFHATKTFPIGEGGAIICNKEDVKYVKQYLNFGMNKKKEVVSPGINGKINEYACAIGLSILPKMSDAISKRLNNTVRYKEKLSEFCPVSSVKDTVYQVFPLYLPSAAAVKRVRKALSKECIQTLQYYKPLVDFYKSTELYKKNICLPVHQDIEDGEISYISETVLNNL